MVHARATYMYDCAHEKVEH